ncbi:MAG TPA: M28 family peptidase [Nitrospirota bacterium]|nr:M28 family peptidase [Nitrospirota bacterium]
MLDTAAYLRKVVTELAQEIGVRTYLDADRLERCGNAIASEFNSFGLKTSRQPVPISGKTYQNVIAELVGNTSPEKILVVGAHYDTVRTTPGADDNASGVAGLLALSRALAGVRMAKTVRFVAFALEEPPFYRTRDMGSYHYARSLKKNREKVEGMICLEMIGFFNDREGSQQYPFPLFRRKFPTKGNYIAMVGNMRSKRFTKTIAAIFKEAVDLPVVTLNAPPIVIGIDFSDHWSFGKFGYTALMVTDTAFYRNPNYHASTDLPETLDYNRMAKVVKGLTAVVKEWGERSDSDEVDYILSSEQD